MTLHQAAPLNSQHSVRKAEPVCAMSDHDHRLATLAGNSIEKLDHLLLTLEGEGRIALRPPLFLSCLSAAERDALLDHPAHGKVLFVDLKTT